MAFVSDMVRRRKVNELITSWVEYRDIVIRHSGQGDASVEEERKFLDLKAAIASRLPLLQESAMQGSLNQELQAQIRGMTDLMNRHLSLGNGTTAEHERNEFMAKWHNHFLYLNRFKGLQTQPTPAMQQRRMGGQAPIASPYSTWGGRRLVAGFFDNWATRFVVRTVIVALVVIIAGRLLNFDFTDAPASARRIADEWWGPKGTSAGVAQKPPTDANDANGDVAVLTKDAKPAGTKGRRPMTINAGTPATKHSVDGSGDFVPPSGENPLKKAVQVIRNATPRPLREFMSPVTQQWGPEVTVAMVGVGLLLVAYMLFGRAR